MKTSSAKAKGRRASQQVRQLLLKFAPHLKPDDVRVTPSGVTGEDVQLSPLARESYPFAIECKNVEKLNIWAAIEQAKSHVGDAEYFPQLYFTRNRAKLYMCMEAKHFFHYIELVKEGLNG